MAPVMSYWSDTSSGNMTYAVDRAWGLDFAYDHGGMEAVIRRLDAMCSTRSEREAKPWARQARKRLIGE